MLTVAVPKRNKLPNIIVLTPKDGTIFILKPRKSIGKSSEKVRKSIGKELTHTGQYNTCLSELS